MKNSKIKRIAADSNAFVAAANAYVDSYWALPGDDSGAGRWSGITVGNAGGTIGPGAADDDGAVFVSVGEENAYAVAHLRCAELMKGSCVDIAAITNLPRNSVGGYIGIDDGSGVEDNVLGLATKVICQTNIESDYATIYDTQFDDGVGTTGTIRGATGSTYNDSVSAAAYAATGTFFVCSGY